MRHASALAGLLLLLAIACQKGGGEKTTSGNGPFVPTPDSSLTAHQIQTWVRCNRHLDSLSYTYEESFRTATPEQRVQYQKRFEEAQNYVCLEQGLRGGYDEYQWITKALVNPRNKTLRDSLGVNLVE
jgi:hypothetical protein